MKNIALMLLAALTLSFGLTACKDEVASEESTVEVTTEDGTTVEKTVESETTVDDNGTMTKETTVETTVDPEGAMNAETTEETTTETVPAAE